MWSRAHLSSPNKASQFLIFQGQMKVQHIKRTFVVVPQKPFSLSLMTLPFMGISITTFHLIFLLSIMTVLILRSSFGMREACKSVRSTMNNMLLDCWQYQCRRACLIHRITSRVRSVVATHSCCKPLVNSKPILFL